MRLKDVLVAVTAAIQTRRRCLQLESKTFDLVPMPGDRWCLPLKSLTVESVSPHERTVIGQACKNFGHVILRVRSKSGLEVYGSIDGKYVEDVELECTQLMFATPVHA